LFLPAQKKARSQPSTSSSSQTGTSNLNGPRLIVQLALDVADVNVLCELTMASDMSPYALITCRKLIANIFLAPFACILLLKERMHVLL
jgi:hypothetical protein